MMTPTSSAMSVTMGSAPVLFDCTTTQNSRQRMKASATCPANVTIDLQVARVAVVVRLLQVDQHAAVPGTERTGVECKALRLVRDQSVVPGSA
jgi:3-deoxy-D-manno-octulosonic acid (KDO) 8-phosphate synthase